MTTLPLCARPGCLYAAVAGTGRCLPHTEPGKGDSSYHGVYQSPGGWCLPVLNHEQTPVPARPYTYTVTATGPPGTTVTVGSFRRPVTERASGWLARALRRLFSDGAS